MTRYPGRYLKKKQNKRSNKQIHENQQTDLHPHKGVEHNGKVLRWRVAEISVSTALDIKQNIAVENQEKYDKELIERLACRNTMSSGRIHDSHANR